MHKKVWDDRNAFIHGHTIAENRTRAHKAVISQVKQIYKNLPNLAPHYPDINDVPMNQHLRQTTAALRDWITCVKHQENIISVINKQKPPGQLTIHKAFHAKLCRKWHMIIHHRQNSLGFLSREPRSSYLYRNG